MPDVQLDPNQLARHAACAATLAERVRATAAGMPGAEHELENLRVTATRLSARMAELGQVLRDVALTAERVDAELAAQLRQ